MENLRKSNYRFCLLVCNILICIPPSYKDLLGLNYQSPLTEYWMLVSHCSVHTTFQNYRLGIRCSINNFFFMRIYTIM
jgi:hypothetical protein